MLLENLCCDGDGGVNLQTSRDRDSLKQRPATGPAMTVRQGPGPHHRNKDTLLQGPLPLPPSSRLRHTSNPAPCTHWVGYDANHGFRAVLGTGSRQGGHNGSVGVEQVIPCHSWDDPGSESHIEHYDISKKKLLHLFLFFLLRANMSW